MLHEFFGCRQIAVPDLLDKNDVITVHDLKLKHYKYEFLHLLFITVISDINDNGNTAQPISAINNISDVVMRHVMNL